MEGTSGFQDVASRRRRGADGVRSGMRGRSRCCRTGREGEASKAAIELGVDDEPGAVRTAASEGAVSRGMARGLRRYQCKGCGRTFNALSGTAAVGSCTTRNAGLSFGASLAEGGDGERASAARCGMWR